MGRVKAVDTHASGGGRNEQLCFAFKRVCYPGFVAGACPNGFAPWRFVPCMVVPRIDHLYPWLTSVSRVRLCNLRVSGNNHRLLLIAGRKTSDADT